MHERMRITSLLALASLIACCEAASVVDHHTVKMHTAFIKARTDQDFSHWSAAFEKADYDGDGKVTVKDAVNIFVEHYNLYHEDKPRGDAHEMHFQQDARDFLELVAQDGWGPERAMTEEEFMEKMHVYVDLKLKERGSLYDVAAHIFHQ